MVEADKLCTHIGLISKGILVRIGRIHHLRENVNFPLSLHIIIHQMPSFKVKKIINFICQRITACQLTDRDVALLKFQIAKDHMDWKKLFQCLTKVKQSYSIEGFTVGDATLDDIFIKNDPEEPPAPETNLPSMPLDHPWTTHSPKNSLS